jgi:hypothetical protein
MNDLRGTFVRPRAGVENKDRGRQMTEKTNANPKSATTDKIDDAEAVRSSDVKLIATVTIWSKSGRRAAGTTFTASEDVAKDLIKRGGAVRVSE